MNKTCYLPDLNVKDHWRRLCPSLQMVFSPKETLPWHQLQVDTTSTYSSSWDVYHLSYISDVVNCKTFITIQAYSLHSAYVNSRCATLTLLSRTRPPGILQMRVTTPLIYTSVFHTILHHLVHHQLPSMYACYLPHASHPGTLPLSPLWQDDKLILVRDGDEGVLEISENVRLCLFSKEPISNIRDTLFFSWMSSLFIGRPSCHLMKVKPRRYIDIRIIYCWGSVSSSVSGIYNILLSLFVHMFSNTVTTQWLWW